MTANSRRSLFAVVAVSIWGASSLGVALIASEGWTARWVIGAGLVMIFVESVLFPVSPASNRAWERRQERIPCGLCPECAYNLRGNVSGRCPECGAAMEAM